MKNLDIISKVLEILPIINQRYPNISYGGCGTFSYHLGNSIQEKFNIEPEFVYIESATAPGGKPDYDVRFSHILLKIDNWLLDNNGKYDVYYNKCKNLPKSKLEEMIHIPELWNNIYDHSNSINMIDDISNLIK
jgi:hypothetical protein